MPFDPITAISQVANTVLDRVLPNKAANDAAKMELAKIQLDGELATYSDQIKVDLAEAASSSVWVSGWRPYVGWVCGTGLAYQFVVRPLFTFAAGLWGSHTVAPELEMGSMMELLAGMLGFGAMRTVEKIQGVQTGH